MLSKRVVVISLAVNLLLIGAIAGYALSRLAASSGATSLPAPPTAVLPPLRSQPTLERPAQATSFPIPNHQNSTPLPQTTAAAPVSAIASNRSAVPGTWQRSEASASEAGDSSSTTSRASTSSSTIDQQLQGNSSASSSFSSGGGFPTTSASVPASFGYGGISVPGQTVSNGSPPSAATAGVNAPPVPVRTITGSVQPDEQGNYFTADGQKVAVSDAPATADGNAANNLTLTVTPDSGAAASDSSTGSDSQVALTHDQDLFRAKWGWSAYGDAEKAAWNSQLGRP